VKVLFVTWDSGATDYLPSLFFPIFAALREQGVHVHTLQGTYGTAEDVARVAAQAKALGVGYRAYVVPSERRRLRMPLTIRRFAQTIAEEAARVDVDIVMPRAIVPAAACMLAARQHKKRVLVWDADGLPADERVDFAGWSPHGAPYWGMRGAEWLMLRAAQRVMVRTKAAAEILAQRGGASLRERTVIVPNGRSESCYVRDEGARTRLRARLGVSDATPVLVSVGTQGPQYLTDLQASIVAAFIERWPDAKAVFLTAQDTFVHAALDRAGVPASARVVQRVAADEVPDWLSAADVGLATRQPSFSQRAVSPLKVGEYLLASLPVIATLGVGDLDTQLNKDVAYCLDVEKPLDAVALVDWFARVGQREETGARARALGLRFFSQDATVSGYLRLLRGR